MHVLNKLEIEQVTGAGVPMPTPHLNGPTVDKGTHDFYNKYGPAMGAGAAGAAIGAAAGAIGGPVGSVIGGAIGGAVGAAIKGARHRRH